MAAVADIAVAAVAADSTVVAAVAATVVVVTDKTKGQGHLRFGGCAHQSQVRTPIKPQ